MAQAKRGYGQTGGSVGPPEAPFRQNTAPNPPMSKAPNSTGPNAWTKMGGAPPPKPLSNNGGLVFILAVTLFAFTFWDGVVHPLIMQAWNGDKNKITQSQGQSALGGLVFIIIATILGSIPSLSDTTLLFVLGLWAVFLIMNGTNQMSGVVNWLSGTVKTTTPAPVTPGGGSGTAPPQKCPGNTVYDATKKQCVSTTGS